VCHGDIKIDNVLLTSWNWVFLADFASFKPTHLPVDNPAAFSYFFDTYGNFAVIFWVISHALRSAMPPHTCDALYLAPMRIGC